MRFDSHVISLLDVTVRLVNTLTLGFDGGVAVDTPRGRALTEVVAAALARGGSRPRVSTSDANHLLRVSQQARVVFDSAEAGDIATAAGQVNAMLRDTHARPQLDCFGDDGWSLHFHGADDTIAIGWAAGCASGLALAIGSDLAGRLGVCAAPACDRVYVDTSKNGRRRFCSTRCQSRVKAAAHRSRRASVKPTR